ncbi:LamG-like jellyroll fold domain-containing protein [Actinoplanes sp. NPDC049118]|uniref:LamG-like jellyroll fold domain-containing protein n=1 Tax=Actinoplanes sp. NPDC049118 TaxID=3155769 RepID=UPI0033FD905B
MLFRRLVVSAILAGTFIGTVHGSATARPHTGARPATVPAAVRTTAVQAASAGAAAGAGRIVAWYAFDGGRSSLITDDSGNGHTLRLVAGNGGRVLAVQHGSGRAVRFPPKCTTGKCPHAALQSPSAANLNPGTKPISYGAMVLLARSQTTKGQNILQKGYSATSSQYKLQVDGAAGRASCVLVGARPGIRLVTSSTPVADGSWHAIECRRRGGSLSVLVDGVVRGNRTISKRLSVANNRPLSLGGKGAYSDNDQFQGILDNVWVRIG